LCTRELRNPVAQQQYRNKEKSVSKKRKSLRSGRTPTVVTAFISTGEQQRFALFLSLIWTDAKTGTVL